MSQGVILFFDVDRNYGKLKPSDSDETVFFSGKDVHLEPGDVVAAGDLVEYGIAPDRRDPERTRAINVTVTRRSSAVARRIEYQWRNKRAADTASQSDWKDQLQRNAEALFSSPRTED